MYSEWDECLPEEKRNVLWGKIIFVSATQSVRRLAPSKVRTTEFGEVVSLKDISSAFGPFTTDITLADLVGDHIF